MICGIKYTFIRVHLFQIPKEDGIYSDDKAQLNFEHEFTPKKNPAGTYYCLSFGNAFMQKILHVFHHVSNVSNRTPFLTVKLEFKHDFYFFYSFTHSTAQTLKEVCGMAC